MLARLSRNSSGSVGAQHAREFVRAMFDTPSGHFWTGTSDPTHIFYNNSPEDCQTWSYLAFQDPNDAVSIDWVKTNLATTDTTFAFNNGWDTNTGLRLRVSGMTYASLSKLGSVLGDNTVDADAVRIEGAGHLIAALYLRGLPPGQDIPSFHGDGNLANTQTEQTYDENNWLSFVVCSSSFTSGEKLRNSSEQYAANAADTFNDTSTPNPALSAKLISLKSITMCRHIGIMGLTSCFNSSTFSLNRLPWHVTVVVMPETDTSYRKGSDRPAIVPSSSCERQIWRFRHDSTSLL
jgi:hypothetical protein